LWKGIVKLGKINNIHDIDNYNVEPRPRSQRTLK